MKKQILQLGCIILLLIPMSIMGQKNLYKDIATLHKLDIRVDSNLHLQLSQAKQIMFIWDSLYDIGKKQQINNILSDSIWEQLFLQEVQFVPFAKNPKINTRLRYYLAQIYHSQKLFSKSIPLQERLLEQKQLLTKQQIIKTYAKIEKAYLQTNDLRKALKIREQRLALKFVESSYDLYMDFELYELALKEFFLYKHPDEVKTLDRYKYYKIIGNNYFEMGKLDSAKFYFNKGLALSSQQIQHPDKKTPINIHQSANASFLGLLGKCYLYEGNYQQAIKNLLIDIEHSDDDQLNKIFKMIHLANAYTANNSPIKAKKFIQKIEQLTKDKEDKRMSIRISEMKAKYFKLIHRLDSSLFYANEYIQLKDIQNESIRKNQAILLLSNIENEARKKDLIITKATLDKERADKKAQRTFLWASIIVLIMAGISLVILIITNIQKSRSKALIEKKNEENELLLKELHHRVKNNLQVIYSLINLQKRRLETEELYQSLSMVQNRIKTMSLVHQNLHENDKLKEVNLEAYIKTISEYLKSLYFTDEKEIAFHFDIDSSIELSMDRAITIGLLTNEILSNSLKYAFKGKAKGQIKIDVQKIQSGIQMKISDDGIGFEENKLTTKSLGMYLIENLVKQIQGRYELENLDGTTYLIYFKA